VESGGCEVILRFINNAFAAFIYKHEIKVTTMWALIKLSNSYSGVTNLCQIVLNHPCT